MRNYKEMVWNEGLMPLKAAIEQFPEEQRQVVFEIIVEGAMEERKLKQRLNETERAILSKITAQGPLQKMSKKDRKRLIGKIKKISQMTQGKQDEYWKTQEAINQMYSKAMPLVEEAAIKCMTKPQSVVADPEETRKALELVCKAVETHGEESVKAGIMVLDKAIDELKNHIEPLKSYIRIDGYIRILLGDKYLSRLPLTLTDHLRARGVKKALEDMGLAEILLSFALPEKEPWLDTVLPTLDMLFQERYQWAEGAVHKMTIPELCIALENAVERDDPSKRSVWELTSGQKPE